jgi:hypothetical protein
VQFAYKDSLIYVISGWHDVTNIADVQIYDPTNDLWIAGTPVPNNNLYKAFGASGTVFGDTIFYFGGAASSGGFPGQSFMRRGIIDPFNPADIQWSYSLPDQNIVRYHSASFNFAGMPYWAGGSEVTYNYDGIAYVGGDTVEPTVEMLRYVSSADQFETEPLTLPMDLRGIATEREGSYFLAGGMNGNQQVTDAVIRLFKPVLAINQPRNDSLFDVFPNPTKGTIHFKMPQSYKGAITLSTDSGVLVSTRPGNDNNSLFIPNSLPNGVYILSFSEDGDTISKKIELIR